MLCEVERNRSAEHSAGYVTCKRLAKAALVVVAAAGGLCRGLRCDTKQIHVTPVGPSIPQSILTELSIVAELACP